jgi:hypothetical protein
MNCLNVPSLREWSGNKGELGDFSSNWLEENGVSKSGR